MKYLCVVAAIVLTICATPALAQNYRFVDLGDVVKGQSVALGINDRGLVVGVFRHHNRERGFVLNLENMEVKPLRKIRSATESFSYVINDSGQMAGVSYSQLGLPYATVWNEGMPSILPSSSRTSAAYGINDAGIIVGIGNGQACYWDSGAIHYFPIKRGYRFAVAYWINSQGTACGVMGNMRTYRPCIWKEMRRPFLLGTLGGPVGGEAWAVNDHNTVVGWSSNRDFEVRAFVWDENGGMRPLGRLSPEGSFEYNYATGINDSNTAVGVAFTDDGVKAFTWTEEMGMIPLDAPAGSYAAVAYAINNRGVIIGYYVNTSYEVHACMWVPD